MLQALRNEGSAPSEDWELCEGILEAYASALRKQKSVSCDGLTITLPARIAEKLLTVCSAVEWTPQSFGLNILEIYLDDVLTGRVGELEGTTLLFDSMAEAKRITAKCDELDRKIRSWRFYRKGRKVSADYSGIEICLAEKEAE